MVAVVAEPYAKIASSVDTFRGFWKVLPWTVAVARLPGFGLKQTPRGWSMNTLLAIVFLSPLPMRMPQLVFEMNLLPTAESRPPKLSVSSPFRPSMGLRIWPLPWNVLLENETLELPWM